MFKKESTDSVAIYNLIYSSHELSAILSSFHEHILNLKIPLINKAHILVAIDKILLNPNSISLFLVNTGFNSLFSIFKDFSVSENNDWGGGAGQT